MEIKVIEPLLGNYTYTASPDELCHLYAEGHIGSIELDNELRLLNIDDDEIKELKHHAYHLSI